MDSSSSKNRSPQLLPHVKRCYHPVERKGKKDGSHSEKLNKTLLSSSKLLSGRSNNNVLLVKSLSGSAALTVQKSQVKTHAVCDKEDDLGLLSGSTTSGSTLLTFAEAMMTGTDLPCDKEDDLGLLSGSTTSGSTLLTFAEAMMTGTDLPVSFRPNQSKKLYRKTLYPSAPQKPLQPSAPKKPLQPHVSFKNVPHVPSSTVIPEYSIERLRF
jgi:hypothetical protein